MANAQRPNIVLVLTGDQGAGELGCYGNPVIRTPNIDSFYDESVHLTDYHVGPIQSPSPGLNPSLLGPRHWAGLLVTFSCLRGVCRRI
jgi:hypothetical protein